MISVIIPILNEAKIIDRSLSQLIPQLQRHELIIVDGGSTDDSPLIAKKYGQVIASHRGRARQMNAGAAAATGAILLFLHADVKLDSGAIEAVEAAFRGGIRRRRIQTANRRRTFSISPDRARCKL